MRVNHWHQCRMPKQWIIFISSHRYFSLFSAHHKQAILIILIPFIFTMINDKHYHHTIMILLLLPQYRVITQARARCWWWAATCRRTTGTSGPAWCSWRAGRGWAAGCRVTWCTVIACCRSPGSGSSRPPTATPPTPASTTSTCSAGQQ